MQRELLGTEHPDVAAGDASLAYWLIDAGKYDEAERLVKESLSIREKMLGKEHPSVATALVVRANLYLARREYKAAVQDAEEAERILLPAVGAAHWQMAMAQNVHGAALAGQRQFPEAERLLLASLKDLSGAPIPGLVEKGRQRLAALYTSWGKTPQAEQFAH
jgi:tetratricopeptide (TPR) repeat protein